MTTEFSHQELSLLVFALEGPQMAQAADSAPSCEEACPVATHFEVLFAGDSSPSERHLGRHLNNHLHEALLECGMLEMMGPTGQDPTATLSLEEQDRLKRVNERLNSWTCNVEITGDERRMLREALSRLPASAWISMPRTLWRVKKKLKAT